MVDDDATGAVIAVIVALTRVAPPSRLTLVTVAIELLILLASAAGITAEGFNIADICDEMSVAVGPTSMPCINGLRP